MSERDKIVDELKRRIKAGFGASTRIYAQDGGVWGAWGRNLPCFHYYELPSEQKLHGRGLYDIILPIQVEYFVKLTRKKDLFEEGREKITEIQTAIELDERFNVYNAAGCRTSEELAIHYFARTTEITEILENVLGVALIYEFRFVDQFFGYGNQKGCGI